MRKYKKNILYLLTAFALVFSMLFITSNYAGAVENTTDTITTENEAASDRPISDDISTDEVEKSVVDEPIEEESGEEEAIKDFNFGEDTCFADEEASYPEEELYPGEEDENGIIWYSRTEAEIAELLGVELLNEGIALLANSSSVITGSTYTDYGCAAARIRVGGSVAYCVIPWSKIPNGVTANFADVNITGTSSDNSNHQLLAKLIYYGYGGGGDLGYGETITHFALSKVWYDMGYTYNSGLSWTYTGGSYLNATGQAKVVEFINKVNSLTNVKGTLKIAQLYASGATYQDIIYGSFEPLISFAAPKITIRKLDENGSAVQGAQFTVYGYNKSTGGYTIAIETKTTNESGEIVFSSLMDSSGYAKTGSGLFLVKETKVPDGYKVSQSYLNDADKADFNTYGGRLYYLKATGGDCVAYRDTEAITVISDGASQGNMQRIVYDHTGYFVSDVYNTTWSNKVQTCWWTSTKAQKWYDDKQMCQGGYGDWYRSIVNGDDLLVYTNNGFTYSVSNLKAHTYAGSSTRTCIGAGEGSASAHPYGGDGLPDWFFITSDGSVRFEMYNKRTSGDSYLFRVFNISSSTLGISTAIWTHDGNQSDIKWLGGTMAAGSYKDYTAPDGAFDNLSMIIADFYADGKYLGGSYLHTQEYNDSIFVNEKTHSITLKKETNGNMADMNAKWDFTINVSGKSGDAFTIVQNGTSSTAIIGDSTDFVDIHVSIGNNETATVYGLADRNTYTISEDNANTDGYTTTSNGITQGKAADNTVKFTNTKNSVVPTGIKNENLFPAILLIIAICATGFVLAAKFSKRQ